MLKSLLIVGTGSFIGGCHEVLAMSVVAGLACIALGYGVVRALLKTPLCPIANSR